MSYGSTDDVEAGGAPPGSRRPSSAASSADGVVEQLAQGLSEAIYGSTEDGEDDAPMDMDALMGTLRRSEKFIAGLYLEHAWKGHRLPELDLDNFYEQVTGSKRQIKRGQRLFALQRGLEVIAQQSVLWLLLLTFFERPWWCVGHHAYRCDRDMGDLYPRADVPLATADASFWLGMLPLGPLLALSYVDIQVKLALPMKVALEDMVVDSSRYRVILTLALGGVTITKFVTRDQSAGLLVATPLLRAAVALTNFPAVRAQIKLVLRTAPAMAAVLFLLTVVIAFYAWIGIVLFPRGTPQGDLVFENFWETYWQLVVLVTTANFPDVMQHAYRRHKYYMFYFGSFIALCIFLLMNVVLAVVSDSYLRRAGEEKERKLEARSENIGHAYRMLSANGPVTKDDIRELCGELDRTFRLIPPLFAEFEAILFGVLDSATQDTVSQDEFEKIVDTLRLRLTKLEDPPKPGSARARLREILEESNFVELFVDGLLIFNALFDYGVWTAQSEIARHGAEGSEDLGGDDYFGAAPRDDAISEDNVRTYAEYHKYVWALWKVLSVLFCCVYVAECAAKLYVMDLKKYYASYGNVFDFLLTAATVLGTTFSLISDDGIHSGLVVSILVLRLLRLMRLPMAIPAVKRIIDSLLAALPRATEMVVAFLWLGFVFSALGQMVFGGKITTDPRNPHSDKIARRAPLYASAADGVGYYDNNFNDMFSGVVLLFELLMVNNWHVLVSAFVAVSSRYARLFFVAWWAVSVLIGLNVVVVIILDTFINVSDEEEVEDDAMEYDHFDDAGHTQYQAVLVDDGVRQGSRRSSVARVLDSANASKKHAPTHRRERAGSHHKRPSAKLAAVDEDAETFVDPTAPQPGSPRGKKTPQRSSVKRGSVLAGYGKKRASPAKKSPPGSLPTGAPDFSGPTVDLHDHDGDVERRDDRDDEEDDLRHPEDREDDRRVSGFGFDGEPLYESDDEEEPVPPLADAVDGIGLEEEPPPDEGEDESEEEEDTASEEEEESSEEASSSSGDSAARRAVDRL